MTAAAPSLVCDELPAVTVPARVKGRPQLGRALRARCRGAGLRRPRTATSSGSRPSRRSTSRAVTGTISSAKRPASIAASARWWLRSANASCSSREIAGFARVIFGDEARCSGRRPGTSPPASGSAPPCGRPSGSGSSTRCRRRRSPAPTPHMMRSAANAIAWRPDEQKRFFRPAGDRLRRRNR